MRQTRKKNGGGGRPRKAVAGKTRSKTATKKPVVPPILLEGDATPPPPVSGPGQRYALGPVPPPAPSPAQVEPGELPEAYGTGRLLLAARDPHWLYAHWDFTREQLRRLNAKSVDRHLVLRIYKDQVAGEPFREIHVHPESRTWFAHVGLGGAKFIGQLGYYQRNGRWVPVATSAPTLTPPDRMSEDLSVWFETLPPELRFEHLLGLVKQAVSEHVPLMEALQQLRAAGVSGLPEPQQIQQGQWTPEQERALAEVVKMDATRRVWMGSLEITELIRRQLAQEMWSAAAAELGRPELWSGALWSGAVASISSPFGRVERGRGFWFNVNAELVIYGATEPDAQVSIGGRLIRLRPDGTFSYRFALPDGQYELPAMARSADGQEARLARLAFSRRTEYQGEVGAHPQDAALKPPSPEHVE